MQTIELYLGENPWPILFALLIISVIFFALLLVTQNGKYLIRALVCVALCAVLLVVDYLWKTDREKIASVITQMASAVKNNDESSVRQLLAPSAVYMQNGLGNGVEFESPLGKTLLKQALDQIKFDYLSIRSLNISAGRQTRRGKADFKVLCSGTWHPSQGGSALNFPPTTSDWSIGLIKNKNDQWLVDRIIPVELPGLGESRSNLPDFLKR